MLYAMVLLVLVILSFVPFSTQDVLASGDGSPTNLEVRPVNATAVSVKWESENRIHDDTLYHIYIWETEQGTMFNKSHLYDALSGHFQFNSEVTGLRPDTYYEMQIAELTQKGDGAPSNLMSVKTPRDVPSRPTIEFFMVEVTHDGNVSSKIRWTRPEETYGELRGYKLEYGIKGQSSLLRVNLTKDVLEHTLEHLEKGVEYELHLSAKNQVDFGEEAFTYIKTPEGPPTGPPMNLKLDFQTPDIVCIWWNPPERKYQNGKIVRYDLQLLKKINQTEIRHWNSTTNKTVISGLEEGTDYMFRVSAATKKGTGPRNVYSFKTIKDMVRAPKGLKAMATSNHSVEVWWNPISSSSLGHKLYGYELFYKMTAVEDLDMWWRTSIRLTESAELIGLVNNAQYTIAVAANTSEGLGRLSNKITVKVKPEDVPMNLQAEDVTADTMVLTWSPPIILNPTNYQVSYDAFKEFVDSTGVIQSKTEKRRVHMLPPSAESFYLTNLSPFTTYNINVTAITTNNDYRPPTRINVTTQMAPPPPMVGAEFNDVLFEIVVDLPHVSEVYGTISHSYLVVVPENLRTKQVTNPDQYLTQELLDWTKDLGGKPYIAAKFPQRNIPETYNLGSGSLTDGFVNRKLQADKKYRIFIRAVVDSEENLYTSSPFSVPLSLGMQRSPPGNVSTLENPKNDIDRDTDNGNEISKFIQKSTVWYIVLIVAVVILSFFLLFLVVTKRQQQQSAQYSDINPLIVSNLRNVPFSNSSDMFPLDDPLPVSMCAEQVEIQGINDRVKFSRDHVAVESGQGQQFSPIHTDH